MIPDANIKDLMLRKDVVAAVKKGMFHIYSVKNIDEGIEILIGKKAGAPGPDGAYTKGTVNFLVNERLKALALGLNKFVKDEPNDIGRERALKNQKEVKRIRTTG